MMIYMSMIDTPDDRSKFEQKMAKLQRQERRHAQLRRLT